MVLPNGKIKLIDFGLCKRLEDEVAYSFCGSVAYLAPEMIKRKGHDKSIDLYYINTHSNTLATSLESSYSKCYMANPHSTTPRRRSWWTTSSTETSTSGLICQRKHAHSFLHWCAGIRKNAPSSRRSWNIPSSLPSTSTRYRPCIRPLRLCRIGWPHSRLPTPLRYKTRTCSTNGIGISHIDFVFYNYFLISLL